MKLIRAALRPTKRKLEFAGLAVCGLVVACVAAHKYIKCSDPNCNYCYPNRAASLHDPASDDPAPRPRNRPWSEAATTGNRTLRAVSDIRTGRVG